MGREGRSNHLVSIERRSCGSVSSLSLATPSVTQQFVNAVTTPERGFDAVLDDAARLVREAGTRIIAQDASGSCELHQSGTSAIRRAFGKLSWPVTWIAGNGSGGQIIRGTQLHAVASDNLAPVLLDGAIAGYVFGDTDARQCILGNVGPRSVTESREEQARQVFERIEQALAAAGMSFSNVVRTWMYISRIPEWYGQFNDVRTQFFRERHVFDGIVPPSTGVGVDNPAGAALIADVLAVQPRTDRVRIEAIPSPLQCPALDYKSSFSRAAEVVFSNHRMLYVSGTASIDSAGRTVHVGDVRKQVQLTMAVVQAILQSRKMEWIDSARAVAYFKDIDDIGVFGDFCRNNGLAGLPVVPAHADICRDDLLFEFEVDAVKLGTEGARK